MTTELSGIKAGKYTTITIGELLDKKQLMALAKLKRTGTASHSNILNVINSNAKKWQTFLLPDYFAYYLEYVLNKGE